MSRTRRCVRAVGVSTCRWVQEIKEETQSQDQLRYANANVTFAVTVPEQVSASHDFKCVKPAVKWSSMTSTDSSLSLQVYGLLTGGNNPPVPPERTRAALFHSLQKDSLLRIGCFSPLLFGVKVFFQLTSAFVQPGGGANKNPFCLFAR